MKYLDKKFSIYYTSEEYKDNWERVFGKKEEKKENLNKQKEKKDEY